MMMPQMVEGMLIMGDLGANGLIKPACFHVLTSIAGVIVQL